MKRGRPFGLSSYKEFHLAKGWDSARDVERRRLEVSGCKPVHHSYFIIHHFANDGQRPKGRTVDTLAHPAEEGRGRQRNTLGSGQHAVIQGVPNGATRQN